MWPIDVRGIKQGHADNPSVVDERDHVSLEIERAVEGGHTHAAEALGRDLDHASLRSG